jgi:hypothetical protein
MSEEPLSTEEPARRNRNAGATYRNIVGGVLAVAAVAIVGLLGTLTFYAITDVEVTAYADGSGALFYEIDPSSNLRLAQIAEKEAPKTCSAYESC